MSAICLGLLIFLFPPLYGEGYEYVSILLNGGQIDLDGRTLLSFFMDGKWGIPLFFLLILILKVFSMSFTNAGGGVGGTFGPTLFVGAMAGFVVARVINLIFRIANRGELLTHDSDQAVLTLLKTSDLIESDFTAVKIDDTLGKLVDAVSKSSRNIFPVIDSKKHFQGYVSLEDIRKDMFKKDMYDSLHVYNFMRSTPEYVYIDEKMDTVMAKFEKTGAWNLPVVDKDRTYIGFVSKSKIFSAYRDQLRQVSHD